MHAYHDEHGTFPPAVVYGEKGPLYSWRVLLLPYMEQCELYDEFHRDEAWDSPHNLPLLKRRPMGYAPPGSKNSSAPEGYTFVQVFIGKGAAFERPTNLKDDFPDGTSNTLLIVEGGPPVPWTKPEDIAFELDRPLPELATVFKDMFRVAYADGSVRQISKGMDPAVLRALVTRNGGEEFERSENSESGEAGLRLKRKGPL
jgi:hypothetical protein